MYKESEGIMNNIELQKTYLLTRIYRSIENENQIMSACLEPVFTNFEPEVFEENLNKIVIINQENGRDLINFLRNASDEVYSDGTFVRVFKQNEEHFFEIANDTPEAKSVIEEYNRLTQEINEVNEL